MKLIEGIRTIGGRAAEIPDCSRGDLPELFKELGFKRGVEIGVYKGGFTLSFAKAGLEIYGVDPFSLYDDYYNDYGQKRMDEQYNNVKALLEPYPNCKLIRKTSMEALKDFQDGSLDFVYIDGNHMFKYVAEDIAEWSKKVKVGGIISGHDYVYIKPSNILGVCHVRQVVDAYTLATGIKDFWILGRKNALSADEKRDRWRSWMWFNPKRLYNTINN